VKHHCETWFGEEFRFSEEELDLAGEFFLLVRDGRNPGVEDFLARHPGHDSRLRPVLEGALMYAAGLEQYRRDHPDEPLRRRVKPPTLR